VGPPDWGRLFKHCHHDAGSDGFGDVRRGMPGLCPLLRLHGRRRRAHLCQCVPCPALSACLPALWSLAVPTVPSGHFAATESQRGRVGALEAGTDSAASWLAHVAVLREEMWTQAGGGETVIVYARADVGKSSCKNVRAGLPWNPA